MSGCTTADTGWRAGETAPLAFEQQAAELAVALTRVARGDAIAAVSGTAEEMGAVLEGRFTLVCGEESHSLSVGDGILVPRGEPRRWRLDSDHGVLYRVWRHADATP